MVTEKMKEAGLQIASDLMDAQFASSMWGLGGRDAWDAFINTHGGQNLDLIKQYVNGEIDSVTAIYIAMNRASNMPDIDHLEIETSKCS